MRQVEQLGIASMSEQTLDYRSPDARLKRPPSKRVVYVAAGIAALGIVITDTTFVIRILTDKNSWDGIYVMLILGPATNGIICVLSLAFIPLVRHVSRRASIVPFVLAGVLLPILAVLVDATVILTLCTLAANQPVQVHHPP